MTGIEVAPELPLEELFFVAFLPYVTMVLHGLGRRLLLQERSTVSYPAVALLFLAVAAVVAATAAVVRRPGRRWWLCTAAVAAVLLVLTAVFDSLMIAADLFRFDESRLLGVARRPGAGRGLRLAARLGAGPSGALGAARPQTRRGGASMTRHDAPAREPGLLRALVGSSRPLSWVNTAYPFAAAYLLAGGGVDAALVVGTVYFLVPYNLLMYGINDVFDYESDLRNAAQGRGGGRGAVAAAAPGDARRRARLEPPVPGRPALVRRSVASDVVLAVVVFAVVAYSAPVLRFKERPVLDSVTSSTHFVGPAVFGLVLAGGAFDTRARSARWRPSSCWGMASQAFGAVQDIGADREAGIGSIATVLGAATTVRVALGLYVAAGVAGARHRLAGRAGRAAAPCPTSPTSPPVPLARATPRPSGPTPGGGGSCGSTT